MPEWIIKRKYESGTYWVRLQWLPKVKVLPYRLVCSDRSFIPPRDFHNPAIADEAFNRATKALKRLEQHPLDTR